MVLSCSLVEEGGGLGGMGGGGMFTRTPATLVLRDLAVTPDLSPETLTPFVPNPIPNADAIIIEAKGWFIGFFFNGDRVHVEIHSRFSATVLSP